MPHIEKIDALVRPSDTDLAGSDAAEDVRGRH